MDFEDPCCDGFSNSSVKFKILGCCIKFKVVVFVSLNGTDIVLFKIVLLCDAMFISPVICADDLFIGKFGKGLVRFEMVDGSMKFKVFA